MLLTEITGFLLQGLQFLFGVQCPRPLASQQEVPNPGHNENEEQNLNCQSSRFTQEPFPGPIFPFPLGQQAGGFLII